MNIESKFLIPDWVFSRLLMNRGLQFLIRMLYLSIAIHLSESVSISGKLCFHNFQLQISKFSTLGQQLFRILYNLRLSMVCCYLMMGFNRLRRIWNEEIRNMNLTSLFFLIRQIMPLISVLIISWLNTHILERKGHIANFIMRLHSFFIPNCDFERIIKVINKKCEFLVPNWSLSRFLMCGCL